MAEFEPFEHSKDIVGRLRDRDSVVLAGLFHAIPTMREAADEIERLRAVVRVNGLRWGHSHAEIDALLFSNDGGPEDGDIVDLRTQEDENLDEVVR